MEFITYGPNSAQQGLDEATAYNRQNSPLTNPAAYGSAPAAVSPASTSAAATTAAIASGNQVNAQLPGYDQSLASVGQNIQSLTAGQVPADVMQQLQQQAAESGAISGSGSNAAYLKALGLTSLGLEQTGQQDLQNILTSLPGQAISQNPAFQATTGQQLEAGQQNSVWGAAPNPAAAAAASLAATGAGYGVGASSGSPLGWGGGTAAASPSYASPWSSQPSYTDTGGMDTGNAPGSPGVYNAWSGWYSGINPSTTNTASAPPPQGTEGAFDPQTGQWTPNAGSDPTYAGLTQQQINDAQTPAYDPSSYGP